MLSRMKLTKKRRYAVRILIDIAQQEGKRVPLKDTAKRQAIGAKYCEQIIAELRIAGLVESTRGRFGGYLLARPADKISIGDVVRATIDPYEGSKDLRDAAIEKAYKRVQAAMWGVMDEVPLAEAAEA